LPGAVDCVQKIYNWSQKYYPSHQHPNVVLHQPDFLPTHEAQNVGRWDIVEQRIVDTISKLANDGADFAIIPANTVHKVIDSVQDRSPIPVINMLEVVADECRDRQLSQIGIMGTRWTMSDHIYQEMLSSRGIAECLPTPDEQDFIQKALFSELIPTGRAGAQTIERLLVIVANLKARGCDGIALACTELPLVLNPDNCQTSVLDTNDILAASAVKRTLPECSNERAYDGTSEIIAVL
jgi:aspartate racemase